MAQVSDARERLILAALDLMHNRGYNAVGVSELCRQAGVNKGSFYYFFPSKRDLALAVIDTYHEFNRRTILEPAFADDIPPLRRIARFFQLTYAFVERTRGGEESPVRGCLLGNFSLELSTQDPVVRNKLQAIFQEWIDFFAAAIQEAIRTGEVENVDAEASARAIFAYYEGLAVMAKTYNEPKLLLQLGEKALTLVK